MKKLLPAGILGLAGLVGVGALTVPGMALVSSGDDDAAVKREDGVAELVLVDDVDDDDTADNTRTRTRTRGGAGSAADDTADTPSRDDVMSRDDAPSVDTRDTRDDADDSRDTTSDTSDSRG